MATVLERKVPYGERIAWGLPAEEVGGGVMNDEDVHMLEQQIHRLQFTVQKLAGWQGINLSELWGSDYELLEEGDMDQ